MCRVDKCCCLELPTAGKVIGCIGAALQFFGLIIFFGGADFTKTGKSSEIYYQSPDGNSYFQHSDLYQKYGGNIFMIILMIINLVTYLLLFMGSSNGKPNYILPYMIFDMIAIAIAALNIIGLVMEHLEFYSLFIIIYVAPKIYLWIVVYSLYSSLKNQNHNNQGVIFALAPTQQQPV